MRAIADRVIAAFGASEPSVLESLAQQAEHWDDTEKAELADMVFEQALGFGPGACFYLFDITGDLRYLNLVEYYALLVDDIGDFYELYWNVTARLFLVPGGFESTHGLRKKFAQLGAQVSREAASRTRARTTMKPGGIQRIAILSPQICTMWHSPTREAISLACHLSRDHGCEVCIVNTNGMSYDGRYGLYKPVIATVTESLKPATVIPVNYMDFDNYPVEILSLPAERMTMTKLMTAAELVADWKADAIIAHGENLLMQEAHYGRFPSLFVTTGNVVPYAHCDAYWVPGHLFGPQEQILAESFGHSNFLYESMVVTPDGHAKESADRTDFALGCDDFVYVVVGTRLHRELDAGFVDVCSRLVRSDESVRIVFVGTPELVLEEVFAPDVCSHMRNGGFRTDLAAVCRMSDVYLNPLRNGGGTSAQTAILNGLPVVTCDYGHISSIVPTTHRQADWKAYLEYALRLHNDEAFYHRETAVFEDHYGNHLSTERQVARMYDALAVMR